MFDWIGNRRMRQAEWMDEPEADPQEVWRSLRFIEGINRRLGYANSVVEHFHSFSRGWRKGETIEVIDLATGSADIPRALLRWADEEGFRLRIVGLERHPVTAAAAKQNHGIGEGIRVVQADVFEVPFLDRSFDYAMCTMFLHHLDEEQIVGVLRTMDRLTRRGVVVADLLRHRRAYAWIKLLTLSAGPMVRHDAAVSVAQALTKAEVLRLRDQAGLDYLQYHRHPAHRFSLAGEKPRRFST